MAAFSVLRRDLTRYWRNPLRTAMLFAIPLVMSAIFALVFGGGGSDQISLKVLLFDEDDSLLSMLLEGAGSSEEMDQNLNVIPVGEEGYLMMEKGEASALIHLPEGFTADYLAGNAAAIKVVKNPSERFLPMIVDEGVGIAAVGLSEVSRVFRPELAQMSVFTGQKELPEDLAVAALSSGVNSKLSGLEQFLFPPVITIESVTLKPEGPDKDTQELSILAYFLPGFSIMGILFLAQSATRDILVDRESGLLRHLLTAPVTPAAYLMGKCLSVFAVTAIGFTLLIMVGVAAGVEWGPAPAVAALVATSALACGGLLLLIMSLVGSERQGETLSTIVIIVSAMLGGAFLPISQMPAFIRPISASTLVYWATEGFTTLIVRGGSFNDIVPNLAILAGAGVICMVIGSLVLKRRMERGVV